MTTTMSKVSKKWYDHYGAPSILREPHGRLRHTFSEIEIVLLHLFPCLQPLLATMTALILQHKLSSNDTVTLFLSQRRSDCEAVP